MREAVPSRGFAPDAQCGFAAETAASGTAESRQPSRQHPNAMLVRITPWLPASQSEQPSERLARWPSSESGARGGRSAIGLVGRARDRHPRSKGEWLHLRTPAWTSAIGVGCSAMNLDLLTAMVRPELLRSTLSRRERGWRWRHREGRPSRSSGEARARAKSSVTAPAASPVPADTATQAAPPCRTHEAPRLAGSWSDASLGEAR